MENEMAANGPGKYIIELKDWTIVTEASAAASTSLSTASTAATAHKLPEVGQAVQGVFHIVSRYQEAEKPQDVPPHTIEELEAKISMLEDELVKAEMPTTKAFKCNRDHRICMKSATSNGEKAACLVAYAACLGTEFTTLVDRGTT